jgi:glycosyltransferase involved in cell wall biosynthesis
MELRRKPRCPGAEHTRLPPHLHRFDASRRFLPSGRYTLRIALLGTRGIPANYGGFETFAEELSTRLAARGHEVTVYCRERYQAPVYRGVHLRTLPTIRHKYLDTLAHTFISTLHLLLHRTEVALYCNAANAIFTILPRIAGIPIALNVDGIERRRKKWNGFARAWYRMSEYLSTILPNVVITDAQAIRRYYEETYRKESVFIAYGADTARAETKGVLDTLGLEPGRYFLYVSRMEPENRALEVRLAFEQVPASLKLALIGDAPYAHEYIRQVRDTQDPRVVIPGAIYGVGYRELGSWCFAYIHATEVGGTHPALIEAMGRGALVLYLDNIENREVCGDAGLPYTDQVGLTARMREVIAMSEPERELYRNRAVQRVRQRYDWDVVTTQYENLLSGLRK